MRTCSLALLLALFAGTALGLAQGQPGHPPPPPEAFTACEGQEEGSVCAVETPDGAVLEGTCRMPRGDRLVCVPQGAPPRRR